MDRRLCRVLVIDDNEDDYLITSELLHQSRHARYDVTWSATYSAALVLLQQKKHDICLVDYQLGKGKLTGLELLREARQSGNSTPMIMLTAQGDHAVDLAAMEAGAADFLDKGQLTPELLERAIRYTLLHTAAIRALRHSEEQLNLVIKQLPAVFWTTDMDLHFTSSAGAALANLGLQPMEVVGQSLFDYFQTHNPEFPLIAAHIQARNGIPVVDEIVWAGRVFQLNVEPFRDAGGHIIGCIGLASDITERKQMEERLKRREAQLAEAQQIAHLGSWEWDLTVQTLIWSDQLYRIAGLTPQTPPITYVSFLDLVHPDDRSLVVRMIEQLETTGTGWEVRIIRSDGVMRVLQVRGEVITDVHGQPLRLVGTAQDITERKHAEQQLQHDALHDALTGLPNRVLFMDRLERLVKRSKRHSAATFAVLFLDLDRFKIVNDSLGHFVGDQLLVAVARRLEACLRASDTVARLGGDEFTILLDDMYEVSTVLDVAERIHEALAKPYSLDGHQVVTTVSIGVVFNPTVYDSAENILRDADTALYRAKALGKARHEVFDRTMHTHALARLQLEADLRRAIEYEELILHYQPVVSLQTGRVVGVEALVRWLHPQRGMVPPMEFIPVAEETGLIVPIGEWVLRTACQQLKHWHEQGFDELYVAVNVSARQFKLRHFNATTTSILQEVGLDCRFLKLELTESILIENIDTNIATITGFNNCGIDIAIDDFGTGYSSLSYLKRFPVHVLKIDRSFVNHITNDPANATIVTAVIMMAHGLGLHVVAEGVESLEQLELLHHYACDAAQGYFISRPVPSDQVTALLSQVWQLDGEVPTSA